MAANGSGKGDLKEAFKDVVNGLNRDDLNAARLRVLGRRKITSTSNPTESNYTEGPRAKDLSAFMAYTASLAFFACTKPCEIIPQRQLGVKETLVNGTTIQHVRKDALKKCVRKMVRFRVTKYSIELDDSDGVRLSNPPIDPYLEFTNGTSTVMIKVLEDILEAEEDSYHFLPVRNTSSEEVRGYIAYKDASGSVVGLNELLTAFPEKKGRNSNDEFKLDVADVNSRPSAELQVSSFKGKTITVKFSYDVISVSDFVKDPAKCGNCKWLDDAEVRYFGNQGSNWDLSLQIIGIKTKSVFPMAYIERDSTSTKAWFYWNKKPKTRVLVLAFPGTDTFETMAMDAATSNATRTETLESIRNSVSHPKLEVDVDDSTSEARVHSDYLEAYLSIRDAVLDTVYLVTQWSHEWLIIVTGHSDGGALATLAAYDIATKKNLDPTKPDRKSKLAMFTFAAPALGNEDMAEEFSTTVPFGFRVVANNDQLAHLMSPSLQRLGKPFPCDGRPYTTIQDILTAETKDLETNSNSGATGSSAGTDSLSVQVDKNSPELSRLHGVQNYFTLIQKFLSILYP